MTKTHSYKRAGQDLVSVQELSKSKVCQFHYAVTVKEHYAHEVWSVKQAALNGGLLIILALMDADVPFSGLMSR